MDLSFLQRQFNDNPQRIRPLVEGLSQEEARFRPAADSWSVLEVVNHLLDEEIHDFRSHLGFILHPQGKEWEPIDPVGWVTQRNYNQRDLAESLESFLRERRVSIEWLASLDPVDWDIAYTSEFGTMRAGDMFAAWVTHDHHHLRQLVELHRALTARAAQPYDFGYAGDW
ncbi:MAG: DinB family protein [Anaerolineales bacterium]